ncbi:MAG TPA: alpha/beta fold hydrolase [Burkholderiales bacterium]|nr:alpha/beta fold hydrolase [Burkholderiales bacterium]
MLLSRCVSGINSSRLKNNLFLGTATALLAACAQQPAQEGAGPGYYGVAEVGSFHIGGRQATLSGLPTKEIVFTAGAAPFKVDPNGEFEVEQMYVQYVKLFGPYARAKYPLLMWHGGGLTGVTWETKPDGRPGWQQFFLKAGHDVYVSDAVERGRASWARYPEIFKSEPFFRTKKEAWELFRIGPAGSYATDPAARKVHAEGTQFPVEAFDQFVKQGVPRWATNDAATQAAYDALVQKVCPCVIIVHSQGGNFALNAALKAPDKVKAVVAVEISGAPDPAKTDLARVKGVPHLFVWGDYVDRQDLFKKISVSIDAYENALRSQGGVVDRIDIPKTGVRGNSHMLMMDRNSDQIAQLVQDWMQKQGLMK